MDFQHPPERFLRILDSLTAWTYKDVRGKIVLPSTETASIPKELFFPIHLSDPVCRGDTHRKRWLSVDPVPG